MPEERVREGQYRRQEVSVLNWMGTMLLFLIPIVLAAVAGYLWNVNLIVLIGATILADMILMVVLMLTTRRASKRNGLIAALILTALLTVLSVLACAFFGAEISSFIQKINAPAAAAVDMLPQTTPEASPMP